MGITLGRAKFQPFTSRGTYSNWGLNGRCVEENVRFPTAISRRRWKITINR